MKRWLEPQETPVPAALREAVGGHPLVAETLARRGITDPAQARAFLDPHLYRPAPPTDLPGLLRAAERVEEAIRRRETICIWGDFDADGQTSTAVLLSTLRALGATVCYHVPHRRRESHGVNLPVLKDLLAGGVDLLLTCDTGITAHKPLAYAVAQGVDVLITDHHDLPETLPPALAAVNPKMLPADHPLRELPGVGVAYQLAALLYERAGRPEEAERLLDLVAIGIVADVAVLTGDTRYLLQRGLEVLRRADRLGLRVMMELTGLVPERLTEEHVAYLLAPRLNSLGRLDDATAGVEFLLTADLTQARTLATTMEGLNARRKLLCDQVAQAAIAQIEQDPTLLDYAALVLSHPAWPPGVVGVVAGRLAERYHRPTILIATPEGEMGRGSARSVPGCDIHAAIAAQRDLLVRFGGHPMAAGLTIAPERIPDFRRALSRTVREMCGDEPGRMAETLPIAAYLPLADLSLSLAESLERLAPFGPGHPPPTLATRDLRLRTHTPIGRTGEHLRLLVEDEAGTVQKVVWWQWNGAPLPTGRFDLAYTVRAGDYRGRREVQVEWVDARPAADEPPVSVRSSLAVNDWRPADDPHRTLERLRAAGDDLMVWAEGEGRSAVAGRHRYDLEPARTLVIWTAPPGPDELRDVLRRVSPAEVHLFGQLPVGGDDPKPFLERLAQLVGEMEEPPAGRSLVEFLAGATAQREETVRAGLEYLAAKGYIRLRNGGPIPDAHSVAARLRALLEETAAYRAYFRRAETLDLDTLART